MPSAGNSSREISSRRWTVPTCQGQRRQTTVTYTLAVDINMPMIGMFKRKAEKTIIDSALKGLKNRVER